MSATPIGHAKESVVEVVKRCDEKMKSTRGIPMSLASFNRRDHPATWLTVGNGEGSVLRRDARLNPARGHFIMRGGMVSLSPPFLQPAVIPLVWGEILLFSPDGPRIGLDDNLSLELAPQDIAGGICAKNRQAENEAIVLVPKIREGVLE